MRALGLVGLLLALLIVGLLVKKQMGGAGAADAPAPVAAPAQQVQQFKRSLDKAMQRPPMPDDGNQ